MPLAMSHSPGLPSTSQYILSAFTTNPVHAWYSTELHWCIPIYRTVPPCTAVVQYIPLCVTGHDPGDFLNADSMKQVVL